MINQVISTHQQISQLSPVTELPQRAQNRLKLFHHFTLRPHAKKRGQQRGISPQQMSLVLLFGKQEHVKERNAQSACSFSFDHASLSSLEHWLGDDYTDFSDHLGYYIVIDTASLEVITCAHRLKRKYRH